MKSFLTGIIPVLETPFHPDGEIDIEGFVSLVDHVSGTGVVAVAFPGFASEFHKLSGPERDVLVTCVLERLSHRADIGTVVTVADHATVLAVKAAERAAAAGADVINVIPPYFLGPAPSAVAAHLSAVLAAVSPVPVIVQHSPALTGLSLSIDELADLAAQHANFRAVKVESTPPGPMVTALAQTTPPLGALVGYGGLHMLDALRRGALGTQPGCSFTEIYVAIWGAWSSGDTQAAEELHRRLLPYVAYWMQGVELIVQAEKTISMRRGLIRSDHCRTPGRNLDRFELETVDRFLAEFAEILAGPNC